MGRPAIVKAPPKKLPDRKPAPEAKRLLEKLKQRRKKAR